MSVGDGRGRTVDGLVSGAEDHRAEVRRAIGEVAHELSRPLAAVLNYAELALQDPDLSEGARARIALVVQHAEACRQVVLASLEIGLGAGGPGEPVDVNVVVRRAIDSLSHLDRGQNVALALSLDPAIPSVLGSRHDLEAAIRNLLENAIEAGASSVEAITESTETGLRLTVRDNGPGIDPSIADRLFEPFASTKRSDEATGLGLAIVRRVVLDHGGQVTATSLSEGGAVFTVDLPAAPARPTVPETPPTEAGPVRAAPGGEPRRALLIDDDESMRRLLSAYLQTLGYQSTEVGDGGEGLQAALAGDYDVIICDVKMPSMDGLEFRRRLGLASPERAGRVIFSTGVLASDPAEAQLRALPNPRLRKPYRLAGLRAALAAVGKDG